MDEPVFSFLKERWRRPLDITTVRQAQDALSLPRDDAQRWRLYERLIREPAHLADKRRFGVSPLSVTLTNEEKLAGRALLLGRSESQARDDSGTGPGLWDEVKRALVTAGLLARDRWRLEAGYQRVLSGIGLLFHTIRAPGETYNVP